ncbi:VCBS repeat-containing protein [Shewanella sp. VB17]|uniref:FG-GAP-like repeat-containing protein n=1 Tax=Shewanella sp. VB17 TaxID=2739432 RepID=UPI001566380D|nr:FG-GAP-like repeat-containing protein [Shewanella sp. VB17]NRD72028.1 VCBS repeat-containing protein [Shewanella sp. VB17]
MKMQMQSGLSVKFTRLIKYLVVFTCFILSSNVQATQSTSVGNFSSSFKPDEHISLLNTNHSVRVKFWSSIPRGIYDYAPMTPYIKKVSLRVGILNGSFIREIQLPKYTDFEFTTVDSVTLFKGVPGKYRLTYEVLIDEYTIDDSGDFGDFYSTEKRMLSSKIVTVYKNTPPRVTLSSTSINTKLGKPAVVTVKVSDSGGKLKNYPRLSVTGSSRSRWTTKLISCSKNTATAQVCKFQLKDNGSGANVATHGFTAKAVDKFGLAATANGSIKVTETNTAPTISASINKTKIGLNQAVVLTANASDVDKSSKNRINLIRWCYTRGSRRGPCSLIIRDNMNSKDKCLITNAGANAKCQYSRTFTTPGTYTLWAEVSNPASSSYTKSASQTLTVVAPPTAAISSTGTFALGNSVTLSATSNAQQFQICYGANGASKASCAHSLKLCTSSPCQLSLTLDSARFKAQKYDFYTFANDGVNAPVSHSVTRTVLGGYSLSAPIVDDAVENVLYPQTRISIKGDYNKLGNDTNPVARIELYANNTKVSTLASPAAQFAFDFTVANVPSYQFKFKLIDKNNNQVWSSPGHFTVVASAPQQTPKVTGPSVSTDGRISLSATRVANVAKYQWFEYKTCPQSAGVASNSVFASTTTPELLVQKTYNDNGDYCYCARATNPNGHGPMSIGSQCAQVKLDIADADAGFTRFDPNLSLTATASYALKWINHSAAAKKTYLLETKIGQPGSDDDWRPIPLASGVSQYQVTSLPPGDVSYRIQACNGDDICENGQILTINHQVPYIHKAQYVAASVTKPAEIVFEGLGMAGLTKANVQLRNSTETFSFNVYQAAGDNATQYRLAPNAYVLKGLDNGGLRLRVNNAVGHASIEFDKTGSSDRTYIDLIEASPTVSDQGIVYVSAGQSVHALKEGNNLTNWPFTLPADTPAAVRFTAAPTIDQDINANDVIYVGATNRYVYKLGQMNQTPGPRILWQTRVRGEVHAKAQLLNEPDPYHNNQLRKLLYVGVAANGGNDISGLYALNADTGAEHFMYPLLAGVKQQPQIFTNGDMHVTTEDKQLHIINRTQLGPFALRWQDIDSSLIKANLDDLIDWQIPADANVPLRSFAGLFYGLLGRAPSQAELTFFAYAYWSGMGTNEITAAFLGSEVGLVRFTPTLAPQAFIDALFYYLFPAEEGKTQAGGLSRAGWAALLVAGHPRSEVAYSLIQTEEYYSYSANAIDLATKAFYDHCNCNEALDSDSDGVLDIVEIEQGYNPLDPRDLIIDEPVLSATAPQMGDFSVNWQAVNSPDSSKTVFYRISERINNQGEAILFTDYTDTHYGLVKASGHYEYRVQACIAAQICSQWSNSANVSVGDSIVEAGVQPEAAPDEIAPFSAPSGSDIATSARFGLTAGQFSVNEAGAASYSLPFALPSGIAGVAPQLALAYNSQSGEGLAGTGWNLQGISAISRCGSAKLIDGVNRPVTYDANDHYCLNGQRLLLKSGVEGQPNSTYVTEIANQQLITYQGNDSFIVEAKDKSLVTYGGNEQSKIAFAIGGYNSTEVTQTWLLSQSQDNLRQSSNQILYHYINGAGEREKLLSSITYSGNRVELDYNFNGRIKSAGYIDGEQYAQRADLTDVKIYNHNGVKVREYRLSFSVNGIGLRQLTAIAECGLAGVCKKPVRFSYRDVFSHDADDMSTRQVLKTPSGKRLRQAMIMDTNNDGTSEVVSLTQVSGAKVSLCVGSHTNPTQACQVFNRHGGASVNDINIRLVPTDPDGDGLVQFLVNKSNDRSDAKWVQIDVLSDGRLSAPHALPLDVDTSAGLNLKPQDFNGDGYNDLIETIDDKIYIRGWDNTRGRYNSPVQLTLATGSAYYKINISAGWQSVDINRDGIADIMGWKDCGGSCDGAAGKQLMFYTASFDLGSDNPCVTWGEGMSYCAPYLDDKYQAKFYQSINVKGKHALPLDINNDGLTDVVVYNTLDKRWEYHINTGNRFDRGTDFTDNANLSSSIAPIVVDLDGDGRLELVFHNKRDKKWYRYEWTNAESYSESVFTPMSGGFKKLTPPISDWTFSPPSEGSSNPRVEYGMFTDVNNNGRVDFVYKHDNVSYAGSSLVLYSAGERVKHPGLLETVTTGTGIETRIEYGSMADASLYTKGHGLPAGVPESGAATRIMNISGSRSLVASVATEAPAQFSNDEVKVNYHYAGSRAQFSRGNLGFESITTELDKQGVRFSTTTEYAQQFPLTGMPMRTVKRANGVVISAAENRYFVADYPLADNYIGRRMYQQESRDCQANVDDINGSVNASSYNCQQLITVQDDDANVTSSQTGYFDSSSALNFVAMDDAFSPLLKGGSVKSLTNNNQYGSSQSDKRFGRLSRAVVTHTRGSDSETRTSAFSYYGNGMIRQEIIEPSADSKTKLVTNYQYDGFGNLINKSALTRSTSNVYDASGRYAVKSSTNGIVTSEVISRNALGQVTKAKNTDGVVTQVVFDAFGAEVARYGASGAQGSKLNKACDEGVSYCYTMVETSVNGVLSKKQYIDRAGRGYQESSLDVLGNWHTSVQTYDKYGRVVSALAPGLAAVTSAYDALDRVITSIDDNTGITSSQRFNGRVQTSDLSGDVPGGEQTKSVLFNALGEQYQVTDELGNVLTYTYDALGALNTVHSSVDNRVISDISYDKLGRKTRMQDENRGNWSYEYDALGQLTKQTDARGVITQVYYDNLGRKKHQKITGTADVVSEDMFWVYGTGDNKHRLIKEYTGSWSRHFYYDNLGRGVATLTNLDHTTNCVAKVVFNSANNDLRMLDESLADPIASRCVIQQTQFDQYGRVFQQFDDYRRQKDGRFVDARGIRQHYQYNQVFKQQEAREGSAGRIYHQIVNINDSGLLTEYNKGNQAMGLSYDRANRLTGISSGNHIQTDVYAFDSINNLSSRLLAASEQQSFDYDGLNRITHVNGEERYQYDDNGNLTNKDGWSLGYNGANKPLHGVVSRSKSGQATETYTYDANGNQVRGLKGGAAWRSFSYSGRNKATEIKVGDKTTRFSYDANNQRFKRTDSQGTIFYVGNLELTIKRQTDAYGTEQTYIKRYLGEAMQTYYADGNAMLRWLYKDHLGSVIAITNDSGKLVKRFSYDVFGLQTEIVPTEAERIAHYENTAMSALFLAEISPNTRGYTGHEPVDFEGDKRIIHMNGRMYDAALGRMLQADPVVQAPDNLQNFNAYSYVLNNPLNATDPSGYFFKNIGSFFKKYWRVIAAVVVAIVSYGYLTEPAFAWAGAMGATGTAQVVIGGAIAGGIAGAASGFVSTGTLQGALNGGLSGAVFGGLGGYFNANTVAAGNQVFLHAAAGGIMAEVQGGNFGHGFITAGVMKGVSFANSVSSGAEFGEIAAKTVIQSMVGGTVSKLTGGKFANGATTAAIQYVVNAASSAIQAQGGHSIKSRKLAARRVIVGGRSVTKEMKLGKPSWVGLPAGSLVDMALKKSLNVSFEVLSQDYALFERWELFETEYTTIETREGNYDYSSKVINIGKPTPVSGSATWRSLGIKTGKQIIDFRACIASCNSNYGGVLGNE